MGFHYRFGDCLAWFFLVLKSRVWEKGNKGLTLATTRPFSGADSGAMRDGFVAAVGAFTPRMVEWDAAICRRLGLEGALVVDTRYAGHEAGDLLQAGMDVGALPTLGDVVAQTPSWTRYASPRTTGPAFFKSCGWAGWDLAAARCAL
jgi:ornithine cyclodeaminase/alanine dehydrogenase-like protein (mu-crystallin family)